MDNVAFHRMEEVKQLFGFKAHNVLLSPAYSPFLSPKEVFCLIKEHVGRESPSNKASLLDITDRSIQQVTVLKYEEYVRHSREFNDTSLDDDQSINTTLLMTSTPILTHRLQKIDFHS